MYRELMGVGERNVWVGLGKLRLELCCEGDVEGNKEDKVILVKEIGC